MSDMAPKGEPRDDSAPAGNPVNPPNDEQAPSQQAQSPQDGPGGGPAPAAEEPRTDPAEPTPLPPRDAAPAPEPPPKAPMVVVRYGLMRQIGKFRHRFESPVRPGAKVVVRTERGVEIGEVLLGIGEGGCTRHITTQRLAEFFRSTGSESPLGRDGKVLRPANTQDLIDQRHLESSAREEGAYCRRRIRELDLKMKLVTVEHLLGGERIVFFFAAESRVDFRELVRDIAGQYRTRIEMRQIGARDEARLVADYERCGRQCCCQQYLKELKPVSMRMAKIQKATLDPSKISGRCGRLMCCLRYEDATYEELRKLLPKKNIYVRTAEHFGRVVDTQILTQLVRLQLADNTLVAVANEDIIERNAEPPPPKPPAAVETRTRPDRSEMRLLRDETPDERTDERKRAPLETEPADKPARPGGDAQAPSSGGKKRRRRFRRPRSGSGGAQRQPSEQGRPAGQTQPPQPAQGATKNQPSQQKQQGSSRSRRRRNKKKRK